MSAVVAVGVGVLAWVVAQLPFLRGLRAPYSLDQHSPLHDVRVARRTAPARGPAAAKYTSGTDGG